MAAYPNEPAGLVPTEINSPLFTAYASAVFVSIHHSWFSRLKPLTFSVGGFILIRKWCFQRWKLSRMTPKTPEKGMSAYGFKPSVATES